jgi:hypothetical protein
VLFDDGASMAEGLLNEKNRKQRKKIQTGSYDLKCTPEINRDEQHVAPTGGIVQLNEKC